MVIIVKMKRMKRTMKKRIIIKSVLSRRVFHLVLVEYLNA